MIDSQGEVWVDAPNDANYDDIDSWETSAVDVECEHHWHRLGHNPNFGDILECCACGDRTP